MIRSIYFPSKGAPQKNLPVDALSNALADADGLLWLSLEHAESDEINLILRDTFHFHPLAIEDCFTDGVEPPKIDDYGNYLFIVAAAILTDNDFSSLETRELNIFLGSNYVVTNYLGEAMLPIETVWNQLERDERLHENGADFLCHAILDVLVDNLMPLLDRMDEEIEYLEDLVLSKPNPSTLERILTLKHAIMSLRRIISPLREMVNRLSRDEFPMIDRQSRIYFRDIYDHLVRIQDMSESIRDIVSSAQDIYLNSTSLRLNEVMKALTIVSTIFLPMSFFAGVYGMNFHYFPEITWKFGYPLAWCIFIAIPVTMLIYFKKKGWF